MDVICIVIEFYEIVFCIVMLINDVEVFDVLLDDDLVFIVLIGQVIFKEDDFIVYWVKFLCFDIFDVFERCVCVIDEMILIMM